MAANKSKKKEITLADLLNAGIASSRSTYTHEGLKTGKLAPNVSKLAAEIKRQEGRINTLGGGKKKGGPSIMSRVFDVLSRGNYLTANIAKDIVGGPKGFNPLSAGWKGVSGKEKTTYSNVLDEAGVKNKWVKGIAGFAGDVLLDPTTYAGVGLLKAGSKAGAATKGARAGIEGLQEAAEKAAKGADKATKTAKAGTTGRQSVSQLTNQLRRKQQTPKTVAPTKAPLPPTNVADAQKFLKDMRKAEKAAAKVEAEEVLNLPEIINNLGTTATKAKRGVPRSKKVVKKGRKRSAAVEAAEASADKLKNAQHAKKTADAQAQAFRASAGLADEIAEEVTPGAVKFTMGFGRHKKVVGQSENLYKLGSKIGKAYNATETGQALNKAFRPVSQFMEGTNTTKRIAEVVGANQLMAKADEVKGIFKNVSPDEAISINRAIEGRHIDSLPEHLQEKAKYVKDEYEKMRQVEIKAGQLKPDQRIDNYVYHWYKKDPKKISDKGRNIKKVRAVGTEDPAFAKTRTIATLDQAKEAGLNPLMRADEALMARLSKHQDVLNRKFFVEETSKNWGVAAKTATEAQLARRQGLRQVNYKSPYIPEGTYFPDNVAKSLEKLNELDNKPLMARGLFKLLDRGQNEWKFLATAANPGHHFRNIMGDMWNNYLDGVVDPAMYNHSRRILQGTDGAVKIGKEMVPYHKIKEMYVSSGAKSGFFRSEFGDDTFKFKPKEKIRQWSDTRENFGRLAHFVDAMKKEAKGRKALNLDDVAARAAMRVRKWNIDYGDITEFEKKIKKVVPFYTWSRKNIPLQLEALAMRPGRVAVAPKSFKGIEEVLGTAGYDDDGGIIPVPKWIRDMSPVRLSGEGQAPWFLAPALPVQDIGRYTEGGTSGVLSSLLSQITPIARIPIEKSINRKIFSGAPIRNNAQYAAEQVPLGRILYAMAKSQDTDRDSGNPLGRGLRLDQLVNYLSGAGAYQVDPNEQASELRRRQDPLQSQLRSLRTKAMKERYG